jgi:transposase
MSLRPEPIGPVPEETARVARAAFPRGSIWLRLRDELGTVYQDEAFAPLFPTHGRPAEAPWRLALVTVLQFAEGLSDRQAAEAVRARLDRKYLLGLELERVMNLSSCRQSQAPRSGPRNRPGIAPNQPSEATFRVWRDAGSS